MSVHAHKFLVSTIDPDWRRCFFSKCEEVARVAQPRPAPAAESSPTSVAAAQKAERTIRQASRMLVWGALRAAGARGLTDRQIRSETGLSGDTERPRRWELVKDSLVIDSGTVRDGMTVWRVA